MNLLLDTHALLWWVQDDERLGSAARGALIEADNEVMVSAVTGWEIVVKVALGKLRLSRSPSEFLSRAGEANGFGVLPIHMRHALALADLPEIHRDPFDRMLVAQAITDGLTILTGDPVVARYPAPTLW